MTSSGTIRVLLADDHHLVRAGLRALLEQQPDLEVVAEVGEGNAVVAAALSTNPDVAAIDITMPGLNGMEVARTLAAACPQVRVVAVSVHTQRSYVEEMLKAGAAGYVTKRAGAAHLVEAIRCVHEGRRYLEPWAAAALAEPLGGAGTPTAPAGLFALTARQRHVLQLIAEGRNTKEVANTLGLSTRSIDAERKHIMDTLGIANLANLVRYAIKQGITPLDV